MGGAERICVTISNLVFGAGYDVTVLELNGKGALGKELSNGVSRVDLERNNKFSVLHLWRLGKLLRKYDVIHIHMRHVYRYVFIANLIARKCLIFHDHFNQFPTSPFQRFYFRTLLYRHVYIGVDQLGIIWAETYLKLRKSNIFNLPNVILQVECKVEQKENTILLVSNIKPEKNIEFVVPFATRMLKGNSELKIDIVGAVSDQLYFEEIKKTLTLYDFANRIQFITDVSAIQPMLGRYQLGLHFSKRESGPLVLLEYLSQNLPFVSFYTGDISKKLEVDLPKFFLHDFNVDHWCDRVNNLLNRSISYPDLPAVFKKHNNVDAYLSSCLKVYHRVYAS